jgi:RNA polymerase sigma factor (sigma-70 family)
MTDMINTKAMPYAAPNDSDLVAASLSGDRDAFGQIVARYQSLVCSLAYSATGSLTHSEDLAQETFVAAWKSLGGLREPAKLRSWLCSIARNLTNNWLRIQGREPSHAAEPLEIIHDSPAPAPQPRDQTISNEEQAILWRSLERIPETYRQPLVLFYREHQSIEAVAEKLELSEENVRTRLSRGRKLLAEEVAAFVEGALARTKPGKTFTIAVLASLPATMATSAKAATVGGAIAKGGSAIKGTVLIGSLGGLFASVGALYFNLRAEADNSKSKRERDFMQKMIGYQIISYVLKLAVLVGLTTLLSEQPLGRDISLGSFLFVCCADGVILFDFISRRRRQIQIEDGTFQEAEWIKPRMETANEEAKGKSKWETFLTMIKVCAFPVIFMTVINGWNSSGGDHSVGRMDSPHRIIGWLLFCIAFIVMLYRGRQRRPRFLAVRPAWQLRSVVFMGVLTLLAFNLHQSRFQTAGWTSTPTVMVFNVAAVLAYGALAGILIWKRKRDNSSAPRSS